MDRNRNRAEESVWSTSRISWHQIFIYKVAAIAILCTTHSHTLLFPIYYVGCTDSNGSDQTKPPWNPSSHLWSRVANTRSTYTNILHAYYILHSEHSDISYIINIIFFAYRNGQIEEIQFNFDIYTWIEVIIINRTGV